MIAFNGVRQMQYIGLNSKTYIKRNTVHIIPTYNKGWQGSCQIDIHGRYAMSVQIIITEKSIYYESYHVWICCLG